MGEGLITWTKEFETGVKKFDAQHKILVEMINRVHELLKEHRFREAVDFFRRELVSYLENHLREEEEFMSEIQFPDYEIHRMAHDNFKKIMYSTLDKIDQGPHELSSAIALTWGWLYSHILKVDKRYGLYLKSLNQGTKE
ncbi:bacteriohemerythrin [Hydrogenivirga sp.]